MTNTIRLVDASIIFILSVILFISFQFHHEFILAESHFVLFVQEMMRNGISFFPTTYQHPHPDYPATLPWLIYLSSHLSGQLTIISAVLPSAIASALTLSLTYLIGASLDRLWGWYAVLFSLFTFQFLEAARTINLDAFVSLATISSFYLVYSADHYQQAKRLWLLPVSLVIGFLFRGPIGLIIPASIVCGYYLLEKRYSQLVKLMSMSLGLGLGLMLLFFLAGWYQADLHFSKHLIYSEVFSRLTTSDSHYPFFYFVTSLWNYALSYPMAIAVIILHFHLLWQSEPSPAIRLLKHLSVWSLLLLMGLSIPTVQKARYLLPIVPALALIAGYLFISTSGSKVLKLLKINLLRFCYSLPLIGLLAIPACFIAAKMRSITVDSHFTLAASVLILISLMLSFLYRHCKNHRLYPMGVLSAGVLAMLSLYIFIASPINVSLNRSEAFVKQIMALQPPHQAIAFYQLGPNAEDIKFMVSYNQALQPTFLQTPAELLQFIQVTHPALIITSQDSLDAMPEEQQQLFKLLLTGNLGHKSCVVLQPK